MIKLTMAGSDAKPIWLNADDISAVTKSMNVKGDAVVVMTCGTRYDVTETAKNVVDALAALP
jgi:uncharacterized protein YlzI (FlbEa/FlbD family)